MVRAIVWAWSRELDDEWLVIFGHFPDFFSNLEKKSEKSISKTIFFHFWDILGLFPIC